MAQQVETVDATEGVERNALMWNDRATVSWLADGALNTVRFGFDGAGTTTRPAPMFGSDVESVDVTLDGARAVIVTGTELVEIDADGTLRWRLEFSPSTSIGEGKSVVRYGLSGGDIWLYRPDVVTGRADRDVLFLVDARRGAVRSSERLATMGYGAEPYRRPDGRVLIEIAEGQVGVTVVEAWWDGGRIRVRGIEPSDRCLMGVSLGDLLFTVDVNGADAVVHRYPDGEPVVTMDAHRLATAAGLDALGVHIGLGGGFLDDSTVFVRLYDDEDERDDLPVTVVADLTGTVVGTLPHDVRPLGDRTWVERGADGVLTRRARG